MNLCHGSSANLPRLLVYTFGLQHDGSAAVTGLAGLSHMYIAFGGEGDAGHGVQARPNVRGAGL